MDKKMMRWAGIAMMAIGVIVLFVNLKVGSFSFFRSAIAPWVMLLLGIDIVCMVVRPHKIFTALFAVLICALVVSVMMNIRVYLLHMSMIKWIFILVMIFGGIGLYLKGKLRG